MRLNKSFFRIDFIRSLSYVIYFMYFYAGLLILMMGTDILYETLDKSFEKALNILKNRTGSESIVDLFLYPNPDNAEFSVIDDESNVIYTIPVSDWNDLNESDYQDEIDKCERYLRTIVENANEKGAFDKINIMKPFSVVMVDDNMDVISELLYLDDENLALNDDFVKKLDEDLDTFFDGLMKNI